MATNIGTEGWSGVPDIYYGKSVSVSHNVPFINPNSEINVLCLLESEAIVPTYGEDILNSFDLILTWRNDIINNFPQSKKFIYGTKWVEEQLDTSIKQDKISYLTSSKVMTSGHAFRHMTFQLLSSIKYSKNNMQIDCFWTPPRINSKNEIFDTYKFSIIMENDVKKDYFTEKLIDCLATKTIPVYWGCPNISEYFDMRSIFTFNNFSDLLSIIDQFETSTYDSLKDSIEYNFNMAKHYYGLWDRIENEIKIFLGENE
jgi:hypothetical protein